MSEPGAECDLGRCYEDRGVHAAPRPPPRRVSTPSWLFIEQHSHTSEHKPHAPDRAPACGGHSPWTPEVLAGLGFPKPSFLTLYPVSSTIFICIMFLR